jgi:CheY-like chemotaxis protein
MKPMVLVADDDAELCQIYGMLLVERGYEVETATDGLDCLRKLRRRQPTVLVLDLELRWGGGDGVLAWLREEDPTGSVPVILTATAGPPVPFESAGAPVVRRLWKPFSLATLLDCVRTVAGPGEWGSGNREPDDPTLLPVGKEAS